ncbi:MAG: spore coat U domain-containing protein [Porphyrobacter sp.]|jgi:spore coat protein U-like protein|nr:spore coat U domain-containing protein [Porphyrobacter sp.]
MTAKRTRTPRHWRVSALTLTALYLAFPGAAQACSLCSCSASTAGVSFGVYDANAPTPDDSVGTVTIDCTGLIALLGSIEVSASPGSSGHAAARTMRNGADQLSYNLFVDPARTVVFGNGAGGTQTITAPLNGLLIFRQAVLIFGRVAARQRVRPGNYSDSIIITVTY